MPARMENPATLAAYEFVAEGMLDRIDTVDRLPQTAVDRGLAGDSGQDEIQATLARAFATEGGSWIL